MCEPNTKPWHVQAAAASTSAHLAVIVVQHQRRLHIFPDNTFNSAHAWSGTRLGFWANGIVGWEEVWGCWRRCVGQLEAFWAFKKSQGGEILGTATKSLRLGIYGEPSRTNLVPVATGFVPMADAEPAAEQLVTLQCGERTLETLDWESVLRTQGEDFWDDARFLAGDLNDTPIALLDKDWEGDECERRSFVVRVGDIVYVFDDSGALRDDPVAGTPNGEQSVQDFCNDMETGYYKLIFYQPAELEEAVNGGESDADGAGTEEADDDEAADVDGGARLVEKCARSRSGRSLRARSLCARRGAPRRRWPRARARRWCVPPRACTPRPDGAARAACCCSTGLRCARRPTPGTC